MAAVGIPDYSFPPHRRLPVGGPYPGNTDPGESGPGPCVTREDSDEYLGRPTRATAEDGVEHAHAGRLHQFIDRCFIVTWAHRPQPNGSSEAQGLIAKLRQIDGFRRARRAP